MMKPTLQTVLRMQGNVAALKDGRVQVDGFELSIMNESEMKGAFRRMVRSHEFEVCEMALTTYVAAKEYGAQFTALPIFLVREFHHGAILFNRDANIEDPRQLEGMRVGVDRGYTVTTSVWARSILADEFGVDLSKITWVISSDEHVENFQLPGNVERLSDGLELREELNSGGLPCVVGFFPNDIPTSLRNIVPLFPEGLNAGIQAFVDRGHYPINHLIVVRNDILEQHPRLPSALFDAFSKSKAIYVEDLAEGRIDNPDHIDDMHLQIMKHQKDPLPYGLAPNRDLLENYLEHCMKQQILKKPTNLNNLFEPSTLDLVG